MNSWTDPQIPFTLEGVSYWLDAGPDLYTLYAQKEDGPRQVVSHYGPGWRPREVFTAAVCHRFHLLPPA